MSATGITAQILAIQRDQSLTDAEKAVKRQALLSGKWIQPAQETCAGARDRAQPCVKLHCQTCVRAVCFMRRRSGESRKA